MDILRGKTPDVVDKEFWAHLLAYNLTRRLMNKSGAQHKVDALRLSVKSGIQLLLSWWRSSTGKEMLLVLLSQEILPNRSGLIEPRVKKRRPKSFPLMTKPRNILKQRLFASQA